MGTQDDWDVLPAAVRKLEDDLAVIQEYIANEEVAEGKRRTAAFSDEQRRQIHDAIAQALLALLGSESFAKAVTKEFSFLTGQEAKRFILWLVGASGLGSAITLIVNHYFGK
jgi:hypothetical protein